MNDPKANLPEGKKTVLGLYVTAKEAYEKWQAAPDTVKILDVRTPEEFLFVGSPEMAWRIPVIAQSYEWDATKGQFPMKLLPDFAARVQTVAKPDDILLITCRSGGRSAIACNLLAKAGFKTLTTSLMAWKAMPTGIPPAWPRPSHSRTAGKTRAVRGPKTSPPNEWCCRKPPDSNKRTITQQQTSQTKQQAI